LIYIKHPLIWSQAVVDKIWQKHHVTPEETEEVIDDDKPICHKGMTDLYYAYGQAMSGRYLFIVLRRKGRGTQYRVITVRDMQDKEKRYYRKHRN
jgi:uncharacterized DUF497 family protein